MKKQTIYYEDLLNDDFAGTKIKHKPLPARFRYVHNDPFSIVIGFVLYYFIAIPILWCYAKISRGVKISGKKNIRSLKRQAVFFYGNHTQIEDAWIVQAFFRLRRSCIIADQDATSIPGIRYLLKLLGCLPVPETPSEHEKFVAAIQYHVKKRHGIVIYPEAHIWPYCTRIRPFGEAAFTYPAELNVPVVPFCVTYRKRKVFKNASPRMTVHIGKPIYPDMGKSIPERKQILRDRVYDYMVDKSAEDENVEWVRYVKKPSETKEE